MIHMTRKVAVTKRGASTATQKRDDSGASSYAWPPSQDRCRTRDSQLNIGRRHAAIDF